MISRYLMLLALILAATFAASAQVVVPSADNRAPLISKPGEDNNDDHPKSFRETLVKMRIEKEKKEFGEMLERGEEAMKLSIELEKSFAATGRLDPNELNKLAAVEKLVKKIRSELGGDDNDDDDWNASTDTPPAHAEAVKSFRAKTGALLEELKKTTRFTVSAAAIQTSNAVLKLVKFLRLSK